MLPTELDMDKISRVFSTQLRNLPLSAIKKEVFRNARLNSIKRAI